MGSWTKRQYSKGERPSPIITQATADYRYRYLRVGEVVEVDPRGYRVKLEWKNGAGSPDWVPIPFPYVGPSGCLGQIPELHSLAICGYYSTGLKHASPFILTFLPPALLAGIDHSDVKDVPDAIPNEDENIIKFRFRDLAEGDMILKSSLGGTLIANKSIQLSDILGSTIKLRYADQSILSTSVANYLFADGASVSMGPAVRNNMVLYDANGVKLQGTNGSLKSLPDIGDVAYIVPYGAPIAYDTQYYSEYRVDADELCDAVLDSNDVNAATAASTRDPIVSFALGNYIGADSNNSKQYGVILRPSLFANPNDRVGAFSLVQAMQNKGQDEVASLGLAFALHFLKSGSFIGVDKEGQLFINLAASSSNPQGTGRSMSTLATGGLKEIWGPESTQSNSWDLTTKGGIRWQVGAHNTNDRSRSIDIRTSSSIYIEVNGEDDDMFGKQEMIYASSREVISGKHIVEVAEENLTVSGLKSEKIMGSAVSQFMADKSENVAWSSTEIVSGEKQCRFGSRKASITKGDDELQVTAGFRKEKVLLGGHQTDVISGILSDSVKLGSRSSKVTTGNYEVAVTSGSISVKTQAGVVTISGTSIDVSALAKVTVKAPIVELGNGPARSGVVTGAGPMPSHFDFVTGAPLKGLMTVKAGT